MVTSTSDEIIGLWFARQQSGCPCCFLDGTGSRHLLKVNDLVNAFNIVQKMLFMLRRKIYDQTGNLEDSEELNSNNLNELYEYYQAKLTEEDLVKFEVGDLVPQCLDPQLVPQISGPGQPQQILL